MNDEQTINAKKGKMNLPNKLTLMRLCLVPVFIAVLLLPSSWISFNVQSIVAVTIFIVASFTDMLDGKIARKYNLVTDFGKLMDPLADKFLVIAALFMVVYRYETLKIWFLFFTLIVVFRELAVTSIRLIAASNGGKVMAAAMPGKIKTVSQMICISAVFIEPLIYGAFGWTRAQSILPITGIFAVIMTIATVYSGINYLVVGWQYLDTKK